MAHRWKLTEKTFTPAEAGEIVGVSPGTQRQWWRRGFLGTRSGHHARVSVRELAGMLALRQCSDLRLNLEAASAAIPKLSAGAVHHIALETMPWDFTGSALDTAAFNLWVTAEEQRGDEYIVSMLNISHEDINRFCLIVGGNVQTIDDISIMNDHETASATVVIDSWGIARQLMRSAEAPLLLVG